MYTSPSTPVNTAEDFTDGGDKNRLSATDRVHFALRHEIRSGLVNPWDRLTEKTIGEHFGTSRTPVREALARLMSEGLVQRYPDGFGLLLPDSSVIQGLYEARLAIELQGVRRVQSGVGSYCVKSLDALHKYWEAIVADPPPAQPHMTAWDEEFHREVLAAAGEPALVTVLAHINDRIRALRMYGYIANDQLASSAADHLHVVTLLREQRYGDAENALADHISSTRNDSLARALHEHPSAGFMRQRSFAKPSQLPNETRQ